MAYMEKVLQGKGDTHFDFLALSAADTDQSTRDGLMQELRPPAGEIPDNSQLVFGKALLLQQDGKPEEALSCSKTTRRKNGEIAPILLRARLLQALDRGDEACRCCAGHRDNPDDKRLRLTYARTLVEQDRMDDAKAEFSSLVQQYPEDDELRYSLALVCLEAKAWDEAKATWKT
jgi:predicted Zn-dependent protease